MLLLLLASYAPYTPPQRGRMAVGTRSARMTTGTR